MKKEKEHLPLYGVGPLIVAGQIIFTILMIFTADKFELIFSIDALDIPFKIIGFSLIISGVYLNFCAKVKSKLFKNVEENKLITDGVYGIVRNPVYSAVLLGCTGAVFITNDILLFIVPVVCWVYMTVFLIKTEEKWLKDLYGEEYEEYCRNVNRCIPWFPKK